MICVRTRPQLDPSLGQEPLRLRIQFRQVVNDQRVKTMPVPRGKCSGPSRTASELIRCEYAEAGKIRMLSFITRSRSDNSSPFGSDPIRPSAIDHAIDPFSVQFPPQFAHYLRMLSQQKQRPRERMCRRHVRGRRTAPPPARPVPHH